MKRLTVMALALALALAAGMAIPATAQAATETLTLSVIDPIGDNTGHVDVVRMMLDFDPATGDYEITLVADPANPFDGEFRVNILLFNTDDASMFRDVVNDFNLSEPVNSLTLTGTSVPLTGWEAGDTVYTNSLGDTPNPPGTFLYRSTVSGFPLTFLTNEDYIAFADRNQPTVVEVLTPQLRSERLIDEAQLLVATNLLTQDQADGLIDKLTAAIASIEAGRTNPALHQIDAFILQVEGFVPAILPAGQAEVLIQEAQAIQSELDG